MLNMTSSSTLIKAVPEGAAISSKPFALQYTSVILIVLTFTIGALFKPPAPVSVPLKVEKPQIKALELGPEIGKINYHKLFSEQSNELQIDKVAALSHVLKHHDINARISVYLNSEGKISESNAFAISIARMLTLEQYFRKQALPEEAISIAAVEEARDYQVAINFVRAE